MFNINSLISRLLRFNRQDKYVKMTEAEIIYIMDTAFPIIKAEPNLLYLNPSIFVCGNIHGQNSDLYQNYGILYDLCTAMY